MVQSIILFVTFKSNKFEGDFMENITKEALRNQLFAKYFEVKDGMLAVDLMNRLSFIPETWKELHTLCVKNIKYFSPLQSLRKVRMVTQEEKEYLILQLGVWRYVVVDVEKRKNIAKKDFYTIFSEDFFIQHFDERKWKDENSFQRCYEVIRYEGDIEEFIDVYKEKRSTFELSVRLYMQYKIEEAITYFSIDFASAIVHLGFQTPDQFLYENLNFNYDLTSWGMQDAQRSMSLEQMKVMFERVREICIPKEIIPSDLYEEYENVIQKENKQFQKKKKPYI